MKRNIAPIAYMIVKHDRPSCQRKKKNTLTRKATQREIEVVMLVDYDMHGGSTTICPIGGGTALSIGTHFTFSLYNYNDTNVKSSVVVQQ